MRNSDIERFFESLPRGTRVPVTILYEPLREQIDPITGEQFVEVFFDVYKRVPDWSVGLQTAATRIGASLNRWVQELLEQPFTGSYLLSGNPVVHNNQALVMVGAQNVEGVFFLPVSVMESMLGIPYRVVEGSHYLGDRQLIIQDVRISEAGVFLAARLVGEMTGREYFYDWLRNTLEFSVTRLVVGGNFIGYNQVFLNAEIGPMVEIGQVASMLGFAVDEGTNGRVRVAGTDLVGLTFGQQTFVCLRELRKLPITAVWEAASGLLTINHRR